MTNTASNCNEDGRVRPTEVKPKEARCRFMAEYKRKILAEADVCTKHGELGALLVLGFPSTHLSGLQLPLNLDWLGLPNCDLRASTDIVLPAMAGVVGNDAGYAFRDLPIPLAVQGGGQLQVHGQWVVLDMNNPTSLPISLSNALTWQH